MVAKSNQNLTNVMNNNIFQKVSICLLFLSATIPHKIPETFLCFSIAKIFLFAKREMELDYYH